MVEVKKVKNAGLGIAEMTIFHIQVGLFLSYFIEKRIPFYFQVFLPSPPQKNADATPEGYSGWKYISNV